MSTEYIVHKDGDKEVSITERLARYDLDLYGYPPAPDDLDDVWGPQQMNADEALALAAGIIYSVWCCWQDKADAAAAMLADDIPRALDRLREE